MGGGVLLDATGRGQVTVETFDGNGYYVVPINDVLYVTDLCLNLFSEGTAVDEGYKFQGLTDRSVFLKDDEVCALANRQGTKFLINLNPVQQETCAALSLQEWHERMAHQNMEQVKAVLKDAGIQSVESKDTCKACIEGKQHRKPFRHGDRKTTYASELVHADLSGKLDESVGGSRYFLLINDYYSQDRTVYFLQEKSETIHKHKYFIKCSKTFKGNFVKTIKTDNGTEFVNRETAKLLEEKG